MKTNLIQNYILTQNGNSPYAESPAKPKPAFSIENELDNRTFIKPLRPKGRLVKNNIFYAPVNMLKDSIYDTKALKHAVHGEANDHQLGKLNDIGMKLGGLAIALYLAGQKQTPMTKSMEFVGLASFFASMALWKKIGIQLPAQLIHGVNINQEYEDSFGRKKPFYLDPQFLPWDNYTEKQIDKIGDRLGVPRDIENRRDFIQEKMKKIAVQNNTLWMLTAGFATPVMSALICNSLEKPIAKFLDNQQNKYADRLLENYQENYKKFIDNTPMNKLNNALQVYGNKTLTQNSFNEICKIMTEGFDLVTAKAIKDDLKTVLFKDSYIIGDETIIALHKNLKTALKSTQRYSDEQIEQLAPTLEQIKNTLAENNLYKQKIDGESFSEVILYLKEQLEENFDDFSSSMKPEQRRKDWNAILNNVINLKDDVNPISKALKTVPDTYLDSATQNSLRKLCEIFTNFNAKTALLDKYAYIKAGAAPETVIANYWNNFVDDLPKLFGINSQEIADMRLDRQLAADVVQQKIEKICANPEEYKKLTTEVVHRIAHLQSLIKPSDITNRYNKLVNAMFDSVVNNLSKPDLGLNMTKTIRALAGVNGNLAGSLKNVQLNYINSRIENVKNSFNRLLCFIDFNRRISTLTNIDALHTGIRREVKEEMVALTKMIMLQGHAADFATKFYFKRNPEPNNEDFSQIEVKDGKVINKYLSNKGIDRVDMPQNPQFFDESMKLMFDNKLHPETEAILKKNALLDQIVNYRKDFIDYVGKDYYFVKPKHLVWGEAKASSAQKRANIIGSAIDEMFLKVCKRKYNSRQWLKMFGGFGAGLLGASVIAQFFFGKMKTPQRIQQKGNSK